jgi:hypothetical protein
MILSVHRDKHFDEKIKSFRNQGGTALLAARKADEIISRIVEEGRNSGFKFGRRTRNGELRIKNCLKFDLGNGYRLICLRRECRFIVLYIGTHDDCSRWLERNKDITYDLDNASCEHIVTKEVALPASPKKADPADTYEEELLKQADDKILRKIFCGLCERDVNRPMESRSEP